MWFLDDLGKKILNLLYHKIKTVQCLNGFYSHNQNRREKLLFFLGDLSKNHNQYDTDKSKQTAGDEVSVISTLRSKCIP